MEDLERELGPLVDEFNKKVSDIKTEDEDKQKRQDQLKNNFGNLTNDIIKPVMNQFKTFLENKGNDCDVIIYPVTTSGVDPKVSLRIHTKI